MWLPRKNRGMARHKVLQGVAHDIGRSFTSLAITRPHYPGDDRFVESPYTCEVRITDSALKDYFARLEGWWYPEI
jgi:hypothetical protein